ncbi:unnamed protein product, partial [marine sediment metagenome]
RPIDKEGVEIDGTELIGREVERKPGTKLYSGIPLDAAALETAKVLKKLFGKFTAHMENPIDGSPMIRFRSSKGPRIEAHDVPFTETDTKTGVTKVGTEKIISRGYVVEGYDPLTKTWKDITYSDTKEQADGFVRRFDKDLRDQKILYGDTPLTFHMGVDPTEAAKTIIKKADEFADYVRESKAMKAFKPMKAAKALREEFNRSFIDRSGNIRSKLLNKLGKEGYEVLQKSVLSKGASSLAAQNLKQMQKEIYNGMSKNDRRIFDSLVLADRMLDIAKYKTK